MNMYFKVQNLDVPENFEAPFATEDHLEDDPSLEVKYKMSPRKVQQRSCSTFYRIISKL